MSTNEIDVNAENRRNAAQMLGSLGGKVKSEKKRLALIENLKKAREARSAKADAKALINKSAKQSDESNVN